MDHFPWQIGVITTWACWLAFMDIWQRRLPNSLTIGAAGAAILYILMHGKSILGASPLSAISAGIGSAVILIPLLWRGWLGAGDIKMMSAIGFIGGINTLATTFVLSSFLTMPVVLWLRLNSTAKDKQQAFRNSRLPQGLFIALGLMLTLLGLSAANV